MATSEQPQAGEVWGDPERPETWVRIDSSVDDWLLYCGWSEELSGLLPVDLFIGGRSRIYPPAPPREWTAEDITSEQANAWFSEFNYMFDEDAPLLSDVKEMIAAAANVMRVPQPQPVDVDRLAASLAVACKSVSAAKLQGVIADVLRSELSQSTAEGPGGGA